MERVCSELIRSEEEVDKMIEEMLVGKGRYITQGVSFSKTNERQLEMLKYVLLRANSFSGFIKELLAKEIYSNEDENKPTINVKSLNEVKKSQSPKYDTVMTDTHVKIVESKSNTVETKVEKEESDSGKIDPSNFLL